MLLSSRNLQAQTSYSQQYIDPIPGMTYTDNVLIERFRPTVNNSSDGYVMIRPYTITRNVEDLLVSLHNGVGGVVSAVKYHLTTDYMVPKAIAYNSATLQYIITGNAYNLNNNGKYDTWYLLLDKDLTFVYLGFLELQSNSAISANTNSTVVMDVCPIIGNTGTDFAFVGTILESGINPKPTGGGVADRRMFIATLDATNFTINSQEFELDIAGTPIDKYNLPARIIEIPGIYPGLFVTGTGVKATTFNDAKGFFYFRIDYSLAGGIDFVSMDNSTNTDFFSGSALYFEDNSKDIYLGGTMLRSGANAFFFDKIVDVDNNPGIVPFSTSTWSNQVGIMALPSAMGGIPKCGLVGNLYSAGNRIAGRVYGSSIEETLPVLLTCDYDNADLLNWTTIGQNNDLYYYPRIDDNITAVQYYPGHNINEIWYPNHSSAESSFNSSLNDGYGLAGLSFDMNVTPPEPLPVINNTISYSTNACNVVLDNLDLDLVPISSVGTITVTPITPTQSINAISYTAISHNVGSNDCVTQVAFKNNEAGPLQETENKYVVMEENNKLVLNCNSSDHSFRILNLQGALIFKDKILNGKITFNSKNLTNGLYFIEILDHNNKRVKSIKFLSNLGN